MSECAPRAGEMPAANPRPSAEFVLLRVFVEAYLATAHEKPRRRARSFLDAAAGILEDEQTVASVRPIRPSSDHLAMVQARREALAMFERLRPTLLARLPTE